MIIDTILNTSDKSSIDFGEKLIALKQDLFQTIANGGLVLGTVLFFIQLFVSIQSKNIVSSIIAIALFSILFTISFFRKIHFLVRSTILCLLFFSVGVISLLNFGLNGLSILFFFFFVLFLGILNPKGWWMAGLFISGLVLLVLSGLIRTGQISSSGFGMEVNSIPFWFTTLSIFLFMLAIIVSPLNKYLRSISAIFSDIKQLQEIQLSETKSITLTVKNFQELELLRNEKQNLLRQLFYRLSTLQDTEDFLHISSQIIRTDLGYDHCGIFLSDVKNEFAVLKAATDDAGYTMLQRNHRLRIREEGMVGFVVSRGSTRVANDVDVDEYHKKNPLLPYTRSEIVLPLKIGDRVIGAIDLQSNLINAFSPLDIELLENLADYFSLLLIKNEQIVDFKEKLSIFETSESNRNRDFWRSHLRGSRKNLSYVLKNEKLEKQDGIDNSEMEVLQSSRKKIILTEEGSNTPTSTIIEPIFVSGQVIGVINLKLQSNSIPNEIEGLSKSIASKLSIELEKNRLTEEILELTEKESILESISSKVRSAHNIDSILQATASELAKAMDVDKVSIHLITADKQ